MKSGLYRYQYFSIALLFCMANIFLPGILGRSAGKNVYPAFLPAYFLGLLLLLLYTAVFGRSSGGVCRIAKARLGDFPGKVVGIIYLLYFLLIGCELMSFYGLYVSGEDTVYLYLAPAALAVIFAGSRRTAELGRTAVIFVCVALLLAIPLGFSGFIAGDLSNLRGFTCADWGELGEVTRMLAAVESGQMIAVMTIAPSEERYRKDTILAAAIGNGIVLLIALTSLLIEGQSPLINKIPFFSYTAKGRLSQLRIAAEAVLFFCTVFRIAICLRAAVCTAAEVFSLSDERPLSPAFGTLLFAMSVGFSENIAAVAQYLLHLSSRISALPLVILPLILWIRREKEKNA